MQSAKFISTRRQLSLYSQENAEPEYNCSMRTNDYFV